MRHDDHHRTGTENIEDEPSRHYEGDDDPHNEVVRLEARIEELAAKIENCRKFILASRIATWGGGIVLFAMYYGGGWYFSIMSLSAQLIADLAHGTAYSFSEWPNRKMSGY